MGKSFTCLLLGRCLFYEKQSYDVMVAKIRNQYVLSGYYDAYFVQLMKRLRCMDDPRYFECPLLIK